jgi:hypothetical protein
MPQELTVLNQNLSVLSLEKATDAAHIFVRASRKGPIFRSIKKGNLVTPERSHRPLGSADYQEES